MKIIRGLLEGIHLNRLWRAQGRPLTMPVVVSPGRLLIYPDGRMHIYDWVVWEGRMEQTLDMSDYDERMALWEHLSAYVTPEWIHE